MSGENFNYWKLILKNDINAIKNIKKFNLNFGPQHPASHGVLRIILQLSNEVIEKSDSHIGLLHRGSEKLMEDKSYLLGLPYLDRMDYVSVLTQEHAYCLAIENLLGTINYQAEYIQVRVIFDELTRILNHLMAVTTHSLDVGCMASVFWGFEEREKIMEFYERVSGARMHAAFYRPNDLSLNYITNDLLKDIINFSRNFLKRISIIESKLLMSNIWRQRLTGVGYLNSSSAILWGLTGVLSRSSGLKRDIRLSFFETYANYYYLTIRSFIGYNGDCYDRYLIRMREMVESVHIIIQIINKLNLNKKNLRTKNSLFTYLNYLNNTKIKPLKKNTLLSWYVNMEDLINHFKYFSEGLIINSNHIYKSVEGPKGEFGINLISDNTNKPYRCKIRPSSFFNLQSLNYLVQNHFFSDLVTIVGSQDLVMGEVDR